ncbi:helix-turn-helix domain-containing protein [Enterobacter hormaechei]|uniref:helix-turn-helix domain-containing protein n=1 Tax=Enterobacter hormaechei TaxID=158836 RepID=UPI002A75E5AE|nr:helix-turn-helix domain-containing protein [Enterobacter hormaechei]
MSMLLMAKAMTMKVGNPLRKLVLLKLADNASDLGECWPSYQHIADQCEISKRSVMNHIDALCDAGLVRKEYRPGPKGNSSNVYHLSLHGAGDSLGGSAANSPGGAGDSLGGSAGAAPRTSHSFEPINEPIQQVANAPCEVHDVSSKYAFAGNVIRLNHEHFQKWKALYRNIDLVYELNRLDIEFTAEKPKNWFITASQKLSYQNKQSAGRPIQKTTVNQSHWNDKDEWENNFL